MKKVIGFLLAVFLGCGSSAQKIEKISEDAIIIDVRTAQEFKSGHIKDALNIPYEVIGSKIEAITKDKDSEIVLYCRSGRRSGIALETLKKMGYTQAINAGGYETFRKQLGQ